MKIKKAQRDSLQIMLKLEGSKNVFEEKKKTVWVIVKKLQKKLLAWKMTELSK